VNGTVFTAAEGLIGAALRDSAAAMGAFMQRELPQAAMAAAAIADGINSGGKVLIFGNGGSAADAQHVAGELVNYMRSERRPLACIALTTDTSVLTAIANDVAFDDIFARQILALGRTGDVGIALSTSGNSANVLQGIRAARRLGIMTIGFTGRQGGQMKELVDLCVAVPSDRTERIQEVHMTVLHGICEFLEQHLCETTSAP
jgi:D-sedoheptulose 7-phosphate isomerase